jgi:fructokinase
LSTGGIRVFTVLGEALLDLVQTSQSSTYDARPGGGPLNIAVGLRRLGHPTSLMARLSTRPLGEVVRRHIYSNDLIGDSCVDTDQPATLAFASLDQAGRASYDFYVEGTADWGWTDAELATLPRSTTVLHTGSLAAAIRPGADSVLRLVQRLHAAGDVVVSFDPNVRPDLVGPHAEAVGRVEQFVAAADLVKASDEDLAWLYPQRRADDVLAEWSTAGPQVVVITRGADGCTAHTAAGGEVSMPGVEVTVEDTIGAGDAFMSGLLSGLADARCLEPGLLASLQDADLRSAVGQALVVSALTCERVGADPPTRSEYSAYLERR